ncbi:MAG: YggS family pyridoxal phosphate-dependent enzyme [Gammaproteobacteria bacterium]|nr:YggS family pyridoxal phosphate-dependent enzyme [Gammaproteobacteria bacterium]
MNTIAQRLEEIQTRITQAEIRFQRPPGSVKLLAVSKTRPLADIEVALAAGQLSFGENYLQDALPKMAALNEKQADNPINWHYIGPIQSNKTSAIAEHFHWVHTVDRLKIAQRLNDQRPDNLLPLNVCIQVNISADPNKSGLNAEETEALAQTIRNLPRLKLRGLMTIPKYETDFDLQRLPFAALQQLFETLNQKGFELDTLSMGMTQDMEAAIAEGATLVRVGTGIFGERHKSYHNP